MKVKTIMPLLIIVAAFLFAGEVTGQTNANFNNLTVRNQARIMGTTYIDTTLYLRGLKPHIVAMNNQWVLLLDSATENVYKIKLSALIDSVPAPAQYWELLTDSIHNVNNYKLYVDEPWVFSYNGARIAYDNIVGSFAPDPYVDIRADYNTGDTSASMYVGANGGGSYAALSVEDADSNITAQFWASYSPGAIQQGGGLVRMITMDYSSPSLYKYESAVEVYADSIALRTTEGNPQTGSLIEVLNNYVKVTTDSLTLDAASIIYEDTFWDDMTTSAESAKLGSNSKPIFDYDSLANRWDNADTTTNYLVFNYQLKHAYSAGTDLYPHVHYIQSSGADTVEWFIILYKWTDLGEARPANFIRIHSNNQTVFPYSSGSIHQLAAFPYIEGTGHTESSILEILLYCWSDGELLTKEFDIHFQINKPGSDNEYP